MFLCFLEAADLLEELSVSRAGKELSKLSLYSKSQAGIFCFTLPEQQSELMESGGGLNNKNYLFANSGAIRSLLPILPILSPKTQIKRVHTRLAVIQSPICSSQLQY